MREALAALEGFSPRSIELASMLFDGYGVAEWAPDASALLSAQMAFFFWLDDRFDGGVIGPSDAVSVLDHIHSGGARAARPSAIAGDEPASDAPVRHESLGFSLIESALWGHRPSFVRRARWRASAAAVVEAMLAESSIDVDTTLSEYVLVGSQTSTIGHLFTTLAWHEDLSFDDAPTAAMIRRLALHGRLHNDLRSLARDEREGTLANAIIVAGHSAPREGAIASIERELERLESGIAASARDARVHPRVREMGPKMLATHEAFYRRAKDRYADHSGDSRA